jgi:hypothetical protein
MCNGITYPEDVFYHRNCRYNFTLKRLLDETTKTSGEGTSQTRRSIREAGKEAGVVFQKICIFCKKENKYKKHSNSREDLRCCGQLRVNTSLKDAATAKNDCDILAILANDLVAKEGWYHHSCYRSYSRIIYTVQTSSAITMLDPEFDRVQQELASLLETPKILDFKTLQHLVRDESARKNLKRKIGSKFSTFQFLVLNKRTLIYPDTLSMTDVITEYFEMKLKLEETLQQTKEEKMVFQTAKLLRKEIKGIEFKMPWPPSASDLSIEMFPVTNLLSKFYDHLLCEEPHDGLSNKTSWLKYSFAQDLIYASK